jgi:hypothetical protein
MNGVEAGNYTSGYKAVLLCFLYKKATPKGGMASSNEGYIISV